MKRILLTSTAIVAFAGAAAADVSFGGDAEVGFNDEVKNGVYWSMGLSVSGSAEIDNGLTASISGDVEFTNAANSTFDGNDMTIDDLVIKMAGDNASLTFGDTAPAADKMWSGVTNMDQDGFMDEGGSDVGDLANEDAVVIGEMTFGETSVGVSYNIADTNGGTKSDDLEVLQVGVTGTAGSLSYGFAYQDGGATAVNGSEIPDIMALSVGMTLGGADLKLAYADKDGSGSSLGLQATYPVGDDISVKVFYVMEDVDAGTNDDNYGVEVTYTAGALSVDALYHGGGDEDTQINFTYDMGNGLNVFGGYRDNGSSNYDVTYIGADYDLGGGANLRASYADLSGTGTANATADELGKSEDVLNGATVEVSFAF